MRNITKIFLLIVVAFFVFLLWPRTPSLSGFDPAMLAKLEVQNWQAQKANKGFSALVARYKIFASQYHFAPISAYRIAQSQASALEHMKIALAQEADTVEENRALSAFTEKYTWIKQQVKGTFDTDSMAREEFAWRSLESKDAPADEVAAPLSRLLAALYGGVSDDFMDVAMDLVGARALIFKDGAAAPDGANPAATAQSTASEAYKLLKEIAATPPPAPAEQQ